MVSSGLKIKLPKNKMTKKKKKKVYFFVTFKFMMDSYNKFCRQQNDELIWREPST